MKIFKSILLTCSLYHIVSSACTFPSNFQGTWDSPEKGTLTINSTSIVGYEIDIYTTLVFDCEVSSGTDYVIRSGDFSVLSNTVNAVLCMSLTEISTNKYSYFILTDELPDASYERVRFISSTSTGITTSDICNATSVASDPTETKIVVRSGSATSEKVQCPDVFLATMYYVNHTTCNQSSWDVCTAVTDMTIDYTQCNDTQAFSATGYVFCVYSTTSGSVGITYVYNNDSSVDDTTTFRFACLMAESSGGYIYMSQNPGDCYRNQSSTYAPSPGKSLILGTNTMSINGLLMTPFGTISVTCVPTTSSSEETSNAGLAAGLAVMFIVLIVAGLVVGYMVYTKKFKKVEPEKDRIIDRQKSVVSNTHKETVTPSVVHTDMTGASHGGGSHGKLEREYTMMSRGDNASDVEKLALQDTESPRKLIPITGDTPREHMSPLDTQLKKQLPPIP